MKKQSGIHDVVCPFCSLLCDDLELGRRADGTLALRAGGCPKAQQGFGRTDARLQPHIKGVPVTEEQAARHAARLLKQARQPLIAGLATDVAGCRAAVALAERCGAGLDHVWGSAANTNMRVLQSRGWMLATLAEVRNRADLLVLVGTDVTEHYPRFLERYAGALPSLAGVRPAQRKIVHIGPRPATRRGRHGPLKDATFIPCTASQVGEVVAALRSLRAGREPVAGTAWMARGMAPLRRLNEALAAARYSVFVWAPGELDGDHGDLVVHDICELVTDLNRTTRSAGLALGGNDGGASCVNVMTWQTGFPLRVSFASGAPVHDPLLHGTARLIDQGGADLLVWINTFNPELKPPRSGAPLIALTRPSRTLAARAEVYFPAGVPGLDHGGTLFRTDNVVTMPLRPLREPVARPAAEILTMIADCG